MIPAHIKVLRERWRSADGRSLALEAAQWLAGDGHRPLRGIGVHEGRVDLRGLTFPDARQVATFRVGRLEGQEISGFPEFESVRWRRIDFTGAVIRNARFFTSTIEDCRFDQADLFDWRLWESEITDCSFVRADLQDSAIGTRNRGQNGVNVWTRVNFDRANLNRAVAWECVLRDCTFRKAKLKNGSFKYVTFDGVVFEGLLDGVRFEATRYADTRDPGPMRNVDFRGVLFRECDIRYKFENVIFDESPDIKAVRDYPSVIKRALELARESEDVEEKEFASVLESILITDLLDSYDSVFFPADFISAGQGEAGAAFGRLIDRAEADLKLRQG